MTTASSVTANTHLLHSFHQGIPQLRRAVTVASGEEHGVSTQGQLGTTAAAAVSGEPTAAIAVAAATGAVSITDLRGAPGSPRNAGLQPGPGTRYGAIRHRSAVVFSLVVTRATHGPAMSGNNNPACQN